MANMGIDIFILGELTTIKFPKSLGESNTSRYRVETIRIDRDTTKNDLFVVFVVLKIGSESPDLRSITTALTMRILLFVTQLRKNVNCPRYSCPEVAATTSEESSGGCCCPSAEREGGGRDSSSSNSSRCPSCCCCCRRRRLSCVINCGSCIFVRCLLIWNKKARNYSKLSLFENNVLFA